MSESSGLIFLLNKDESNRGIENQQDLKSVFVSKIK